MEEFKKRKAGERFQRGYNYGYRRGYTKATRATGASIVTMIDTVLENLELSPDHTILSGLRHLIETTYCKQPVEEAV